MLTARGWANVIGAVSTAFAIVGPRVADADSTRAVAEAAVENVQVKGCGPSNRSHGIGVEPFRACVTVHNDAQASVKIEVLGVTLRTDSPVASGEASQILSPSELAPAGGKQGTSRPVKGLRTARSIGAGQDVRLLVFPRSQDQKQLRVRYHTRYWHEIVLRVEQTVVTIHADVGEFRAPRRR